MTQHEAVRAAASNAPAGADDAEPSFELLREQTYLEARRRRRSPRDLPRLLAGAVSLVWRTNRLSTLATTAVQLSGAVVAAAQVALGGYAVQQLLRSQRTSDIGASTWVPLLLLAVVTLLGGLASTGGSQLGRLLGLQMQQKVTEDVIDVSTAVPLVDYDRPSFHNQLSRVLATMPTQPFLVVRSLASLVGGLAGVVALVAALLWVSPLLIGLLLVAGVPLWYLSRRGGSLEFDFAVEQTANIREREYLVGLLTRREDAAEVRAYNTAPALRGRFTSSYVDYIEKSRRLIRKRYGLQVASTLAMAVAVLGTLTVLVVLIQRGAISLGEATSAVLAIRLLGSRMEQLFGGIGVLFQSGLFLHDFAAFVARRPGPAPQTSAAAYPPAEVAQEDSARPQLRLSGALTADRVSFTYPSSKVAALKDVTVRLAANQVVALVGENGSGKTTLAKILAGLYTPDVGSVRWLTTGGDLVGAQVARPQITVVLQDFARYQLSAFDNIAFGRPETIATDDEVHAAAESAGIDGVLASLPRGYATRLSRQFTGGRELSVGQWQRVALARAFHRRGSLVILDEPAASLDPRAEAHLYESVRKLLAGRTVLLITHRLRSVRGVDRILVMRDGTIVEDGDHDELMRAGGLYAELTTLQDKGGLHR